MLKNKDIIDEKDKRLREISKEVEFPLSNEDRKNIDLMIEYLTNSQIEKLAVPKRYFVVVYEYDEGKFDNYIIINPKIVSNSMEKIYVELGEGCLSVNREVDGIVPRYARVTIEGYDMDGNKIRVRGREELAIAFQHELDHLNGILFYDHIDPKNPYKDQNKYRAI